MLLFSWTILCFENFGTGKSSQTGKFYKKKSTKINFIPPSNFCIFFTSYAVLILFSQLLTSMFRLIRKCPAFWFNFLLHLLLCTTLLLFSFFLLTSSPEIFPLYWWLIAIEILWDERCQHHIFAKDILMPVDCMFCLEQVHGTVTALVSFLLALQFFSRNKNCIF